VTHDINNREYLRKDQAKANMKVELDADFTCIKAGETILIQDELGELYFKCDQNRHYIDGQENSTGTHYVGIYPCK